MPRTILLLNENGIFNIHSEEAINLPNSVAIQGPNQTDVIPQRPMLDPSVLHVATISGTEYDVVEEQKVPKLLGKEKVKAQTIDEFNPAPVNHLVITSGIDDRVFLQRMEKKIIDAGGLCTFVGV